MINRGRFAEAARLRDRLAAEYPENPEVKMLSEGLRRMSGS